MQDLNQAEKKAFILFSLREQCHFSGSYFSIFGLNAGSMVYLSVFSPDAGKCGPEKLRVFGQFLRSVLPRFIFENREISDALSRTNFRNFDQNLQNPQK